MSARGNPNHPVVQEMESQWYKLCALTLFKLGLTKLEITSEDIDRFNASGKANIVVIPQGTVLTLGLVSDDTAEYLARRQGGLPV